MKVLSYSSWTNNNTDVFFFFALLVYPGSLACVPQCGLVHPRHILVPLRIHQPPKIKLGYNTVGEANFYHLNASLNSLRKRVLTEMTSWHFPEDRQAPQWFQFSRILRNPQCWISWNSAKLHIFCTRNFISFSLSVNQKKWEYWSHCTVQ